MDNLKDFMQEWQALHPPPQTQAANSLLLRFAMWLAVACAFIVSAHRTIEAFGGQAWAIPAVGMVEISLMVMAYMVADMFHGEEHARFLLYGAGLVITITFAVTIGGNVYISLRENNFDNPTFKKIMAVLTGLDAPLMLFVGMELLSSWRLTQERRVRGRVAKWEAERAKAWTLYRAELNGQQPAQISAPAKSAHSKNVNASEVFATEWHGLTKRDIQAKSINEWHQELKDRGYQVGRSTVGKYYQEALQNGRAE
jgi:hypothetical protein